MIPLQYILILAVSAVGGVVAKIMPSFILLAKFTYPNAKFNAIGNPFVTNEEMQRILVHDLDDFKNMVNATKDYDITGDNVAEIHQELDDMLHKMINMLAHDSPRAVKGFYDAYLYKLDLSFIKKSIDMYLGGIKPGEEWQKTLASRVYLPENQKFLTQMFTLEYPEFPRLLKDYQYPMEIIALFEKNNEEIDRDQVNIAFDKYMLSRFDTLTLPKQCKKAVIQYVKIYRDILNIKTIIRSKHWGLGTEKTQRLLVGRGRELEEWKLSELLEMENVPEVISHLEGTSYMPYLRDAIVEYEKEDSVSPLEQALDVCLLHLLSTLSVEHTTNLGVGIRFVVSKEYETRNLKVIAKGLLEGLSPDAIKKALVIE